MANKPKIHYAGSLSFTKSNGVRVEISAGFAACCSGGRAEAIAKNGLHTYDRRDVTCERCAHAILASMDVRLRRGRQ